MIASAVRKSLREGATRAPNRAIMPSENAISVSQGIAQPAAAPGSLCRSEIDQGGHDHPADCCRDRQGRAAAVG